MTSPRPRVITKRKTAKGGEDKLIVFIAHKPKTCLSLQPHLQAFVFAGDDPFDRDWLSDGGVGRAPPGRARRR
jgi:hypothetical protein